MNETLPTAPLNAVAARSLRRVAGRRSRLAATFALLLSMPVPLLAQPVVGGQSPATPRRAVQQLPLSPVPGPALRAARGGPTSVTLMTGDRVLVSGDRLDQIAIQPAPGRENVRMSLRRIATSAQSTPHLFAIPEDAAPLVASGKVDRRLFDVSLLIALGYDDAHRATLPFIVTYAAPSSASGSSASGSSASGSSASGSSASGSSASGSQLAPRPRVVQGGIIDRNLPSVNGLAVHAPKATVGEVWRSVVTSAGAAPGATSQAVASEPIERIWLDGLLQPVLDRSVPQIGAPAAWAIGYEGVGIKVAVLDTGIDDTHPDLVDTVTARENFTEEADVDLVGHGTHVASIIAGSGAAEGGRYRGVAPGAELISGKVCEVLGCPESAIIAGMQWAVADHGAEVVNLSLGGTDTPGLDPMEQAVSTLSEQFGALFVVSSGNEGLFESVVSSPGASAAALTVGAVDQDDALVYFSSRGGTPDFRIKPDLTAPGFEIVAARAEGTELGPPVGDSYVALSGTSMAAPHVSGAVALLLDAHPEWTPQQAKGALVGSALFNPDLGVLDQGAGRVDVAAALDTSFLANVTSLSFGFTRWPHQDDAPVTRTVTYRNLGPATELELFIDVSGPDGAAPPEGMFTVTPALVTLPENGSVSVRVIANSALDAADGIYGGRLLASDGTGRTLATPLVLVREEESYDLTLRHLDREGNATAAWLTDVIAYGTGSAVYPERESDLPADVTLRLPRNRYAILSSIGDAEILAPNQLLDADRLLVLDSSAAAPVSVAPPRPGLELRRASSSWGLDLTNGAGAGGWSLYGPSASPVLFYQVEIDPPAPALLANLNATWLDTTSTPQQSHLAFWRAEGRLVPPGTHSVSSFTPTIVEAHYAAPLGTVPVQTEIGYSARDPGLGTAIWLDTIELPVQRTEYHYAEDPDQLWTTVLTVTDDDFNQLTLGWQPLSNVPGQSITRHWNAPMFSPALPDDSDESAYRQLDYVWLRPTLYADSDEHKAAFSCLFNCRTELETAFYRNGELFDDNPFDVRLYELAPERATYRVEVKHSQTLLELLSRQSVAWTFESESVPGDGARLPLLVVRFAPALDARGRAPAGAFELPLYIDPYGQASSTLTDAPSVEASFDDGVTWSRASVQADGLRWKAQLEHPASAAYVSLRTSAVDLYGNGVEQTLIRAYALDQEN